MYTNHQPNIHSEPHHHLRPFNLTLIIIYMIIFYYNNYAETNHHILASTLLTKTSQYVRHCSHLCIINDVVMWLYVWFYSWNILTQKQFSWISRQKYTTYWFLLYDSWFKYYVISDGVYGSQMLYKDGLHLASLIE